MNPHQRRGSTWEDVVALTQAQLVTALADRAELSKRDAKRALDALDEVVLDELGNAQKVRIGQLVQRRCVSSPLRRRVPVVTRRPARRSPSRPSRRAG
ncbi:MAG: HU family DNA-binding protein [Solirubrobacteraceae bacterium]